jgi:hypothetical protein
MNCKIYDVKSSTFSDLLISKFPEIRIKIFYAGVQSRNSVCDILYKVQTFVNLNSNFGDFEAKFQTGFWR